MVACQSQHIHLLDVKFLWTVYHCAYHLVHDDIGYGQYMNEEFTWIYALLPTLEQFYNVNCDL